jgi:ribonuclease E
VTDTTTGTTGTTGTTEAAGTTGGEDEAGNPPVTPRPRRRRTAGRESGPPIEHLADPFTPAAELPEPAVAQPPADEPITPDAADAELEVDEDEGLDAGTADPAVAPAPVTAFAVPFLAPDATDAPPRRRRSSSRPAGTPLEPADPAGLTEPTGTSGATKLAGSADASDGSDGSDSGDGGDFSDGSDFNDDGAPRRRRRRGGRGRGRGGSGSGADGDEGSDEPGGPDGPGGSDDDVDGEPRARAARQPRQQRQPRPTPTDGAGGSDAPDGADGSGGSNGRDGKASEGYPDGDEDDDEGGASGSRRRRRRRRRTPGSGEGGGPDDPPNTVTHVRDGVRGVSGSTRLEAKRQRRRDGRSDSRRRVVVTEAEFLARRESVSRTMVVRKTGERTQVAILEDGVLAEHFVTKSSATSYAGNIFLGRVQNVLPSMEAAFVDIGKGRNAVLYAGEVSYDASMTEGGRPPRIEQALSSGQQILVQVTKDPVGHKGARLTAQISLPGRFLVYVPGGPMAGISRKLPDSERTRLKAILKRVVPDDAGVIVRTAAEGASEEELVADVERLQRIWGEIQTKAAGKVTAPALLHGEPDLVVRAVRDVFNEDITELIVAGDDVAAEIEDYVGSVAPDLLPRVKRWTQEKDIFSAYRVDEQLTKALSRKVHLPSGGSLVIDHTEALTAIDINTGKFTGSGGSLEETVTRNNLEAAEEIARQLRLRDVGGMIIIDFIDMVLEANRDLVLRRLVECLARDRTKHQVSEVTSLGLVQLTRKRVGQGLLESFSESCPTCSGRGLLVSLDGPPSAPVSRSGIPSPSAVAAKVMASAAAQAHDDGDPA